MAVVGGKSRKANPNRGSKPGEKRGGRKAGTPNKVTASVKEALTAAFEGMGGVPKLQAWAEDNPALFYPLWSKLIPKELEVAGKNGEPISISVRFLNE